MKILFKLFSIITIIIFLNTSAFAQYTNVRVDDPQSNSPEEVTIAINPANTNILAAGANLNYFFHSLDGGLGWNQSGMSSSLGVWGDPCVVFDSLGNLYYGHLSNPISGYWIDRIVIQKSTDFGQTWNDGAGIGFQNPKNQDKEWIAVDFSQSQFKGNVYVTWTEFDDYGSPSSNDSSRIRFSKSTDMGETWSDAITISDKSGDAIDSDNTDEGAVPAVGPNGEIYVSWAGPLGLMFDKSTDGGETWGTDVFVSDIPGGWDFDVPGISRCNGLPITMSDISNSPYRGNIYICWGDQRNGSDNTDVFFSRSTDGGDSWSPAKRVNNDSTSRHQFFPWMTVDQTTGNIWAVFYDRRNTTGVTTDVYMARSTDGGETFDNFKVSESSFTPTSGVFFGDYINVAAWNREVRPIWMRLQSGELSVWTALVYDSTSITSVEDNGFEPDNFTLFQNYPNPFNPSTTISYQLPMQEYVTIKVYDVLGNEVETLFAGQAPAGVREVNFNASGLSSGIYFYRIDAGNFHQQKKMILLK